MAELLYYKDQYQTELEAKVVKTDGNRILLDKTIFIFQSKNEPGDLGTISGIKISGLTKVKGDVWHNFSHPVEFKAGDSVKLVLDWPNRLRMMRLHSALHLLAGPFDKNFGKRPVAGVIKGDQGYLAFKEEISDDTIQKAVEQANKDVETGREIKHWWDEKRECFRWTQVGDYIPIPDGGLLVKNTKEIGKIKFIRKETAAKKQKVFVALENFSNAQT